MENDNLKMEIINLNSKSRTKYKTTQTSMINRILLNRVVKDVVFGSKIVAEATA